MSAACQKMICFTCLLLMVYTQKTAAQAGTAESISNYNEVNMYTNPVLPGYYPNPSLLKVANDFIHARLTVKLQPYNDGGMSLFSLMPLSGNYPLINPRTH